MGRSTREWTLILKDKPHNLAGVKKHPRMDIDKDKAHNLTGVKKHTRMDIDKDNER